MSVESNITFITSLDPSQPGSQDQGVEGDNHIRNIKIALRNTFPTLSKAVTADIDFINNAQARVQAIEADKVSTTNPFLMSALNANGHTVSNLGYSIAPNDAVSNQRLADYVSYFIINVVYPVGSLYFTTANVDPNVFMNFGTWQRYAQGRAIVGVGNCTDDVGFTTGATVGQEFGRWYHTLSTSELPPHDHANGAFNKLLSVDGTGTVTAVDNSANQVNINGSGGTIQSVGGGTAHVNFQPSVGVYVWRRIA